MNTARLASVEKKTRRTRGKRPNIKVFWYDFDNVHLYDRRHTDEGAQLVTPEELEQVKADGRFLVLLVTYKDEPRLNE